MAKDYKKGNPQGVYNEEQAKGFSQTGIPEKKYDEFHSTEGANPMTAAEKETNVQKEDKG